MASVISVKGTKGKQIALEQTFEENESILRRKRREGSLGDNSEIVIYTIDKKRLDDFREIEVDLSEDSWQKLLDLLAKFIQKKN